MDWPEIYGKCFSAQVFVILVNFHQQEKHLMKACCDYLKSHLTSENCIGVYNLSDLYSTVDLKETSKKFLLE